MMQPHGSQRTQKSLPFVEAEISSRDRLNYLGLALMRVEADIYLSNFMRWVFNVTKSGLEGEFEKTYVQIAARPWGLCCSAATAKRAVARAESLGMVVITEQLCRNGAQRPNTYRINWEGIRRILNLQNPIPSMRDADGQIDLGGGQPDTPPGQIDLGGGQPDTRYKEIPSSCPSFCIDNSGPVPGAAAEPEFGGEGSQQEFQATQRTQSPDDPRMVLRRSNVSLDPRMGERDVLRAVLFGEIPELAEASRRIVKPLPAGDLLYGTFWSIKSLETLGKALLLAEWHRRQLSVEKPVCGETAADLLLVIAAAEYALRLPSADVQKNRIAIFGAQVSRRKWRQVLHHVPSARKRLDEMQRVYPDVLDCEAWPPTPAVDFRSPLNAKGDPDPPVERRLRTPEEIAEFKREREAAWAEAKRQHEAARAAAKK